MKLDIEKVFITLGLPVGLISVFGAVLIYLGLSLDAVLTIAGSMAGLQALFSLGIDVSKWTGAVNDGDAGKWSALLNLIGVVLIAFTLYWNPIFDFSTLDAQLADFAKFLAMAFSYVIQIAGTKWVHQFTTKGLGVKAFSKSSA